MTPRRKKLLAVAAVGVGAVAGIYVWAATATLGTPVDPADDLVLVGGVVVDADDPQGRPMTVVIHDGVIVQLRDPGAPVDEDAVVIDATGRFVAPGLIDVHGHMLRAGLCSGDEGIAWANVQQIPMNFDLALAAGNTTVVDLGGPLGGVTAVRDAFAGEVSASPRYLVSGPILTGVGGYPLDWADPDLVRDLDVVVTVEDEDAARREVARLHAAGVDVIKVAWMDVAYNDRPLPTMPVEVLVAAVEEAHRHDLRVFVHAHTNAGYDAALQAGADVIAHSTFEPITDELVERVVESRTVIVPTLWAFAAFERAREDPQFVQTLRPQLLPPLFEQLERYDARMRAASDALPDDFLPGIRWARVVEANGHARDNLRRLVDAGATIAYGSDTAFCYALHRSAPDELGAMAAAGLGPAGAFAAATRGSATAIGRPDLGRIAPDVPADLLVLEHNPFVDLEALRAPVAVIRGGRPVPPADPPGIRRTLGVVRLLLFAL